MIGGIIAPGGNTQKVSAAETSYTGNSFELDFNSHDGSKMEIADGWSNGDMFDCTWRKENISFSNNMFLSIRNDNLGSATRWSGAEYRSNEFFHYGLYEVRMKPIKNDGVVSSLFTYTGPVDGNPWDEIDIEFLGKDTTKVQFNYYTNGVGNHEYVYDLGFDAATSFHTYGFEWQPDYITWYVDGCAVYTATENIPSNPGKIMMNVWPGTGVDSWLNPFNGVVPLSAEYEKFKYTKNTSSGSGGTAYPSNDSGYINWSTDQVWGQYYLESNDSSIMVYRYNRNAPWAYLTGNLQKQVTNPTNCKMKLNFIDGNILALTIKVKDIWGNETEIGQVSFSNYQKGIHTFDIPINYDCGTINEVILMINSNPYQLDLNKDANCKVEILESSLWSN